MAINKRWALVGASVLHNLCIYAFVCVCVCVLCVCVCVCVYCVCVCVCVCTVCVCTVCVCLCVLCVCVLCVCVLCVCVYCVCVYCVCVCVCTVCVCVYCVCVCVCVLCVCVLCVCVCVCVYCVCVCVLCVCVLCVCVCTVCVCVLCVCVCVCVYCVCVCVYCVCVCVLCVCVCTVCVCTVCVCVCVWMTPYLQFSFKLYDIKCGKDREEDAWFGQGRTNHTVHIVYVYTTTEHIILASFLSLHSLYRKNCALHYLANGLQRICLHHRDRYRSVTQAYNFCAETHLGGGDTSGFVSPWPPLLERSLRLPVAVPFLGKAHEDSDHTAMIAVVN